MAGNPYLFAGRTPGQPLKDCRTAFQRILVRAGVPDPEELVIHSLRHSVASCLVSAGMTLYDVKYQLGHNVVEAVFVQNILGIDCQNWDA